MPCFSLSIYSCGALQRKRGHNSITFLSLPRVTPSTARLQPSKLAVIAPPRRANDAVVRLSLICPVQQAARAVLLSKRPRTAPHDEHVSLPGLHGVDGVQVLAQVS